MKNIIRSKSLDIFILEDMPNVREALTTFLKENYSGITVDAAANQSDAERFIYQAFKISKPYDALILDLKVPRNSGENPEETISPAQSCLRLCRDQGILPPLVIQWTAYPKSAMIRKFSESELIDQQPNGYFVIDKKDVDYASKISYLLDKLLVEKHIGRSLDLPYFTLKSRTDIAYSRHDPRRLPPVDIPRFAHALMTYWELLVPSRRNEALLKLKGTRWELIEEGDRAKLVYPESASMLRDAKDNADFLGGSTDKA